ncbi:Rossman fold protein, TIGR00730 family [Saccharospirillum sp. MSK14-1]|uniref:LOG family protein n=1 Tax=Saccharospirillum sp. MSK14-1 TaxID=1897632 RepID=UPI000D3A1547|nr:TIGR00730 family Rossman fold protein [Saccharospirillum sp. MSK14-1]PTY36007.1 Rossman fold protein, TIGR00730 family [Saccharospirillum sp. MSK14-1]
MHITVFCGSKPGLDPDFLLAARRLGERMAQRGHDLVYGGAKVGLMGAVADSVLAGGREVIGAIPKALVSKEVAHEGLTQLHVVDTMHQRKAILSDESDAFIALPGGPGTLEELFEVWTWRMLGYHQKPVALFNLKGYYDPLLAMIDRMISAEFAWSDLTASLIVADDMDDLLNRLEAAQ